MTTPDTLTPNRYGFEYWSPEADARLTFETGTGFVRTEDPNAQGYALSPTEARHLAAALAAYADRKEATR